MLVLGREEVVGQFHLTSIKEDDVSIWAIQQELPPSLNGKVNSRTDRA